MSPLSSLFASPPPSAAVEIASDRVTAISLAWQAGAAIVAAHATEPLGPGLVTPALNATNIHDRAAVARAVRAALDALGTRPHRVSLVIPDTAAKVSLLRFEKVPPEKDLDQLIRWQVRKSAPFKPEEAQISWVPAGPLPDGGREFLVTMARRDIVESYEEACADAGAHAGVVDLATLNLVNAVLSSGAAQDAGGDALIVHVAPDYATLAIVRGGELIFLRTRSAADGDGDLADVVHQTAMYHEDRLGGTRFARVLLSGAARSGDGERARRALEERLGVKVEPLDFRAGASMRDRITTNPETLDLLAPAVGIALRERIG